MLTYIPVVAWVFEIQFILQIIVNRVAIVSMDNRLLTWIRWGTVIFISLVNISVFCIFLPANLGVGEKYVFLYHRSNGMLTATTGSSRSTPSGTR